MKIRITLIGPGGQLDCLDLPIDDSAGTTQQYELATSIWAALNKADWMLGPGDTIKIDEVE